MKHDPHSPSAHLTAAADSVGTGRRFGSIGPIYQIMGRGGPLADSDHLMRIRVIESGEELDYPLTDILKDPLEH